MMELGLKGDTEKIQSKKKYVLQTSNYISGSVPYMSTGASTQVHPPQMDKYMHITVLTDAVFGITKNWKQTKIQLKINCRASTK